MECCPATHLLVDPFEPGEHRARAARLLGRELVGLGAIALRAALAYACVAAAAAVATRGRGEELIDVVVARAVEPLVLPRRLVVVVAAAAPPVRRRRALAGALFRVRVVLHWSLRGLCDDAPVGLYTQEKAEVGLYTQGKAVPSYNV